MTWFSSPAQAAERLTEAGYLADAATATTACVAGALENPLLLEVPTTSAVRRSYWLNPEPESSAGDSAARACREIVSMVECRNLLSSRSSCTTWRELIVTSGKTSALSRAPTRRFF